MTKVILKFGPAIIKELLITKDILTIGRKTDNDIVIDNPAISGHHAKIYKYECSYIVEDLGSTNGTFLNEIKILKANLHNNDRIGFAKHTLVFVSEEGDIPTTTVLDKIIKTSDETIIVDSAKQREMMIGAAATTQAPIEKVGALRVVSGIVDNTEIELSTLLVYVGTDQQALVKIKGFFAPTIAAGIARKPEGYILKAVKEGYPKVNGKSVKDQIRLNDGDMLEFGKTKMVFFEKDNKK